MSTEPQSPSETGQPLSDPQAAPESNRPQADDPPRRESPDLAALSRHPVGKLALLLLLGLGLLIPLDMVDDLVRERERRQAHVETEIAERWGHPQILAGPVLVVPTTRHVRSGSSEIEAEDTLVILPDRYDLEAELIPQTRRRGPFEAVVYRVKLALAAEFPAPADVLEAFPDMQPDWQAAEFVLGLSDPRSLPAAPELVWGGRRLALEPGLPKPLAGLTDSGLRAPAPFAAGASRQPVDLSAQLTLNGTRGVSVVPLGRTTQVRLAFPWPHPSFAGAFLPGESEISAEGFSARWSVSYLGRSYPQAWRDGAATSPEMGALRQSAFGVELYQPVDAYRQTERTVKYGLLFILMTYAVIYLYELIGRRRLHPVQYGLVGCALALFYLLLLALAEQVPFALAYAVAATAVAVQVAAYCTAPLGRAGALGLGLVLALLYAGLYVLVRLEDLALLAGSLALFAALTALMLATRKIDWSKPTPLRAGTSSA